MVVKPFYKQWAKRQEKPVEAIAMFLWTRLKGTLWRRPLEKEADEEAHVPLKTPGK